jgi:CRISPR-associated endonuclease Csn1
MNTKDDKKRILFFTGGETASVRSSLRLNRILFANLTDDEYKVLKQKSDFKDKNRKNEKNHALDALVLSVLPEIKLNFKEVEKKPDFFNKEFCKSEISKVYPRTIKQITPKLRETIYGLRCRLESGKKCYYFVSRFNTDISSLKTLSITGRKEGKESEAKKEVNKIFSLKIRNDLLKELENKTLSQEGWERWVDQYFEDNNIKKTAMIDSKCFNDEEVFIDGKIKDVIGEYGHKGAIKGQWIRRKEDNQGQIVYKDEKDKWIVIPVYVFESVYIKRKEYENTYKDVKFFKSGQLVELKKDFQDIKKGVYKLRTIINNGMCKVENINDPTKVIMKNIRIFLEQCGMTNYEKQ